MPGMWMRLWERVIPVGATHKSNSIEPSARASASAHLPCCKINAEADVVVVASLSHHVPDIIDILAFDIAVHRILGVCIERLTVICPLPLTVVAGGQRHSAIRIGAVAGDHRGP